MSGNIYNLTFVKFSKGNTLEVPIKLGRTIRGSSFSSSGGHKNDPYIDALVLRDNER